MSVLVLHPYYKLDYIAHVWNDEDVVVEKVTGNLHVKNWQAEAGNVLKNMVHFQPLLVLMCWVKQQSRVVGRVLKSSWTISTPQYNRYCIDSNYLDE